MSSKPNNIIPLSLTADFFIERASRYMDRYNYTKALRYYRRAVEIEPHNPLHFTNMAGVLGQLGKFQESNEMLYYVLQKLDANAVECHFYLACNYAYMDLPEKAEEHVLIYLQRDPKGQHAKDAQELLQYLALELDRPPITEAELREFIEADDEKTILHEQARELMEQGSFQQAEKILLKLTSEYPEFLAAANNLSLCYYYKGEFAKAREMIGRVLAQDPANIHALCNLAILHYQQRETGKLAGLLAGLKKIVPLQYDQAYKLGITLGVMGEHETAYQLFKKMAVYAGFIDFHLFHYCAVSAYNSGRYKQAEKYWRMVQKEDPGSAIAPYYLEQLKQGTDLPQEIPYYYYLPSSAVKPDGKKNLKQTIQREVERDPFIRSSFLWALRHGDRETKLQVLQAFEWLGDQEVIEALKEFVQSPEQEEDLKDIARFVLNTLGYSSTKALPWRKSWHRVLEELDPSLPAGQRQQMSALWSQFIERMGDDMPVIRKPEAWAAALEWLVAGQEAPGYLQELTARCGASAKTIRKHAELIKGALQS